MQVYFLRVSFENILTGKIKEQFILIVTGTLSTVFFVGASTTAVVAIIITTLLVGFIIAKAI
jgi:hypothetical protein